MERDECQGNYAQSCHHCCKQRNKLIMLHAYQQGKTTILSVKYDLIDVLFLTEPNKRTTLVL